MVHEESCNKKRSNRLHVACMLIVWIYISSSAHCVFRLEFHGTQMPTNMKSATLDAFALVDQWLDIPYIIPVDVIYRDFGNSYYAAVGGFPFHCKHPNNSHILIPPSLYVHLTHGQQCDASDQPPSSSYIIIEVNANSDMIQLYFGNEDHPPKSHLDFRTLLMHEIGHGLGFSSGFTLANGYYRNSPNAYLYDTFIFNLAPPLNTFYPLDNATILDNGYSLFFSYNGESFPVYTPRPFVSGSSISHAADVNSLMYFKVARGIAIRCLSDEVILFFRAMGYTVKANTPPCVLSSSNRLHWILHAFF